MSRREKLEILVMVAVSVLLWTLVYFMLRGGLP